LTPRRASCAAALVCCLAAAVGLGLWAQTPSAATTPQSLPQVIAALDAAAPTIRSLTAHADVADYTALVNDTSRSSGEFYFKRTRSGPMYALNLPQPANARKQLVYRDQTAWVYTPSAHQVIKYSLEKQQSLVDQYLLLGIGGTGTDLQRSFDVAFDGPATLNGVATIKLTLTPKQKSAKLTHIDLWYDTSLWVAVQQQIWQLGGDYHLVHYTQVKRNPKLGDAPFSTKFDNATVVVPQG
jgi:outer membrane lipoprotein-sorting protein